MPELMQGEFRVSASNKGRFCNVRYAVRMLPLVKNTALFLYAECDKALKVGCRGYQRERFDFEVLALI